MQLTQPSLLFPYQRLSAAWLLFLTACAAPEVGSKRRGDKNERDGSAFHAAFLVGQPNELGIPHVPPQDVSAWSLDDRTTLAEANAGALRTVVTARTLIELGFSSVVGMHGPVGFAKHGGQLRQLEAYLSEVGPLLDESSTLLLSFMTHGSLAPLPNASASLSGNGANGAADPYAASRRCDPVIQLSDDEGKPSLVTVDTLASAIAGIQEVRKAMPPIATLVLLFDGCGSGSFAELVRQSELTSIAAPNPGALGRGTRKHEPQHL